MAAPTIRKNAPYFKEQVFVVLGTSSVFVKVISIVVILCFFLSFSSTTVKVLSVTPGLLLPPNFWIWTLFTNCFLEVHLLDVLVDIMVIVLCGKLIEPLWGGLEMVLFFQIVNFGVAILSSLIYLFVYMSTFNTDALFEVHIFGLVGYIAGFSVAVKQIMPDHVLINSPFGKLRNRHIPLAVFSLTVLLCLIRILRGTYPCMYGTGMLVSWIYLRFYQRHSNGTVGDMADNFTFASFFPDVFQPFVAVVCNSLYGILVKMKICKKPVRKYDVGSPTSITISLPGQDPHDAERRRQKALKALNERLNKKEIESPWPNMDDAKDTPSDSPLPSPVIHGVSAVTHTTSTAGDPKPSSENKAT